MGSACVLFEFIFPKEFGPNAPGANKNSVYIAYLDSVKLFTPRELRSDVYQANSYTYTDTFYGNRGLTLRVLDRSDPGNFHSAM